MGEVIIPPWVRPESPETIRWIDDASSSFTPSFGRGAAQRGIWADPRWGLRRRYRGLRAEERVAILNALSETRGQLNVLRVTPHMPLRGSFPATEALSNGTFESGTTNWNAPTDGRNNIAVADRVMRATLVQQNQFAYTYQSVSGLTQNVPYVLRIFGSRGRLALTGDVLRAQAGSTEGTNDYGSVDGTGYGMVSMPFITPATSAVVHAILNSGASSGQFAGDYFSLQYMSLSRCALVDNGQNLLLRSDEFENTGAWGAVNSDGLASVGTNATTGPDGSSTVESLVENTSNSNHLRDQAVTIPGTANVDYAFSVAVKGNSRTWAMIVMSEATGGSTCGVYVNLSTGATGSNPAGANWANLRTYVVALGFGWFQVTIVARKTNSATSLSPAIYLASADGVNSYLGNGSSILVWRATLAQSSVPTRLSQTTSSAISSSAQTGGALHVKGLPVSTNGLLEIGDWFEVAGQLKQCTARLNSNAAGLGYLQFRPALANAPADNDPVVINQPFGRFVYSGARELENLFGIYGDCEMNLEETYS